MSTPSIGHGAKFQIKAGSPIPAFVDIAEVFDITPPNETVEVVDTTNQQSADARRTFIKGLVDPGEASFEMNFLPGSASEDLIVASLNKRTADEFRIVYPNGAQWTFDGLTTGYEPAVPLDDRMTATVTIKVSGSVLREDGV
ncbi:MAG: phage tail tube protein [Brevundimonas sp.]|jgi:hypothetical protein|uniref:phage tail tube protein n=1 Tax=Brevundimonas sp. TaxID=1871086 RepID=UPI00391F22F4